MPLPYKVTAQYLPPPLPLLWAHCPAGGEVLALHKRHYRAIWRSRGWVARSGLIGLLLVWPLLYLPHAVYATARNAGPVRQRTGKSALRQMGEQLMLAIRFGFRPMAYYALELFLDAHRAKAVLYVQRYATKDSLYRMLTAREGGSLTDKTAFATFCAAQGIPAAPVFATFVDGRQSGGDAALPLRDLFVKRQRGAGGVRAEVWHYQDGRYHGPAGVLSETGLRVHFKRLSLREPYLVQPLLTNHEEISDLAGSALATLRVVTARNEVGDVEVIRAVFRMAARPDSVVDNFHAGGIAAAVDLATGTLGPATDRGLAPSLGWVDRHPLTGAAITGRVLPRWHQTLALAQAAHAVFPQRAIIGWDIADTSEGVRVIEGNAATDTDIVQRVHRAPLGATRYAELMNWHIAQRHGA